MWYQNAQRIGEWQRRRGKPPCASVYAAASAPDAAPAPRSARDPAGELHETARLVADRLLLRVGDPLVAGRDRHPVRVAARLEGDGIGIARRHDDAPPVHER